MGWTGLVAFALLPLACVAARDTSFPANPGIDEFPNASTRPPEPKHLLDAGGEGGSDVVDADLFDGRDTEPALALDGGDFPESLVPYVAPDASAELEPARITWQPWKPDGGVPPTPDPALTPSIHAHPREGLL